MHQFNNEEIDKMQSKKHIFRHNKKFLVKCRLRDNLL